MKEVDTSLRDFKLAGTQKHFCKIYFRKCPIICNILYTRLQLRQYPAAGVVLVLFLPVPRIAEYPTSTAVAGMSAMTNRAPGCKRRRDLLLPHPSRQVPQVSLIHRTACILPCKLSIPTIMDGMQTSIICTQPRTIFDPANSLTLCRQSLKTAWVLHSIITLQFSLLLHTI